MNLVGDIKSADDARPAEPGKFAVSKQTRRFQLYAALVVLDLLCIGAGFIVAGTLYDNASTTDGIGIAAMVTPIYLFIAMSGYAYDYEALLDHREGIKQALFALVLATSIILFVAFYVQASEEFSRVVVGAGTALGAVLLFVTRWGFNFIVQRAVGSNPRAELVIVDCDAPGKFQNVPIIEAAEHGIRPNLRDPKMLDRFGALVRGADYVVVACAPEDRAAWSVLLKGTGVHGHVLAPEFDEVGAYYFGRYQGQCVMRVSSGPLDIRNRMLKRLMDLSITVPLIIVLLPFFVLVAIAIKLDSRGPVFFRQERMGGGNRLFNVLKFRSMRVEQTDAEGNRSASRDDDRITRVGRFIRKTSIDELPQLFNVLHGSMSLVGPRPHALGSLAGLERFWEVDPQYWHRHALKPGMTGLAQIRGFRGATKSREDLIKRLQADLEYMNEWSLERDIAIMFATFRVVIHRNAF